MATISAWQRGYCALKDAIKRWRAMKYVSRRTAMPRNSDSSTAITPVRQATRRATGQHFEQRARAWLERQGLEFIAANVHVAGGEIDLIMRQQQVTVFVEVRYRQSWHYGGAAASVSRSKQQKLLRAAQSWLHRHAGSFDTVDCRFDVLAFTANEVEWIKNAFC